MGKRTLLASALLLISVNAAAQSTAAETAGSLVCQILDNIKIFFEMVAAGLAIAIIVINGIRVIRESMEPDSVKKAKESIIHTIVGLIIVILAVEIVTLVTSQGCVS